MGRAPRLVHGDDLLYRFFNNLLADTRDNLAAIPQLLLETMAVWLPPTTYARWPVLLPWVVRDPSCRGRPRNGVPDRWGSPDDRGYLRDDNSLIKSLPRSLEITGPARSGLAGARIGTEFVAAHVWLRVNGSTVLASRWPELNSFVPNLVWLPSQVAKLTDREGSGVQETLQAMAWQIYRPVAVEPTYEQIVKRSWALLPVPERAIGTIRHEELNWFEPTERFYRTREERLRSVVEALLQLEAGKGIAAKVITSRYGQGLPGVSAEARSDLRSYLCQFQREHIRPSLDEHEVLGAAQRSIGVREFPQST